MILFVLWRLTIGLKDGKPFRLQLFQHEWLVFRIHWRNFSKVLCWRLAWDEFSFFVCRFQLMLILIVIMNLVLLEFRLRFDRRQSCVHLAWNDTLGAYLKRLEAHCILSRPNRLLFELLVERLNAVIKAKTHSIDCRPGSCKWPKGCLIVDLLHSFHPVVKRLLNYS